MIFLPLPPQWWGFTAQDLLCKCSNLYSTPCDGRSSTPNRWAISTAPSQTFAISFNQLINNKRSIKILNLKYQILLQAVKTLKPVESYLNLLKRVNIIRMKCSHSAVHICMHIMCIYLYFYIVHIIHGWCIQVYCK